MLIVVNLATESIAFDYVLINLVTFEKLVKSARLYP